MAFVIFTLIISISVLASATTCPSIYPLSSINEIKNELMFTVFYSRLKDHCDYLVKDESFSNISCSHAVGRVERVIDVNGQLVSFPQEFNSLMDSEEGYLALVSLRKYLESNVYTASEAKLWDWAMGYFKGDKKKAQEFLALTLQFNTNYGRRMPRANHQSANELSQIYFSLEELRSRGLLNVLPVEVQPQNVSPYHFYVIAYLQDRLVERGASSAEARVMALQVNNSYELIHSGQSSVLKGDIPEKLLPSEEAATRDIYTGYRALNYFSDKSAMEYSVFKSRAEKDFKSLNKEIMSLPVPGPF